MKMFPVPLCFCLWALVILGHELAPKALPEMQLLNPFYVSEASIPKYSFCWDKKGYIF